MPEILLKIWIAFEDAAGRVVTGLELGPHGGERQLQLGRVLAVGTAHRRHQQRIEVASGGQLS